MMIDPIVKKIKFCKPKIKVNCGYCRNEIINPRRNQISCSLECQKAFWTEPLIEEPDPLPDECDVCKNKIINPRWNQKYCSLECRKKHKREYACALYAFSNYASYDPEEDTKINQHKPHEDIFLSKWKYR